MDPIIQARLALGVRDADLARRHSRELAKLGFTVRKVSRRGVSFEGRRTVLERVFKTELLISKESVQFKQAPTLPASLDQAVDSIYFPSKPTFFQGH